MGACDRRVDRGQLFRALEQGRLVVAPRPRRPRLRERFRQPACDDLKQPLRLLETRQPHLADLSEPDPVRRFARDDRVRCARDEDLPAVRRLADAPAAVDGDPDIAVATKRRLARVQPHPHSRLHLARPPFGCERALGRYGRRDRAPRARKDSEQRVAGRVDLGTTPSFDRAPQYLPLLLEQRAVAVTTEPLEQPRRALDVSEQERDRPLRQ